MIPDLVITGEGEATLEIRLQLTQDFLVERDQTWPSVAFN
jgi:hypothetical protein